MVESECWMVGVVVVLVGQGVGGSGGLFYHDKASGPVALTIDDPLRPGANIGAGSFNMHRVQVYVLLRECVGYNGGWEWLVAGTISCLCVCVFGGGVGCRL